MFKKEADFGLRKVFLGLKLPWLQALGISIGACPGEITFRKSEISCNSIFSGENSGLTPKETSLFEHIYLEINVLVFSLLSEMGGIP